MSGSLADLLRGPRPSGPWSQSLAAAPVARRAWEVAPEPMIPPGAVTMQAPSQAFPLDPIVRDRLRDGGDSVMARIFPPTEGGERKMMGAANMMLGFAGTTPMRGVPLYKSQEASTRLNFRLREGIPLDERDLAVMRELEGLMRPQESQSVLWRGISSGPYARARPGDLVTDPAFMSAATEQGQARLFAGPYPEAALLGFRVPRGALAADLSAYGEREIVLPRNQPWIVEDVLRRPDLPMPIVRMGLPQ